MTATEGQNVEMSCAFQSGSASVYLEIQWWFLRGPGDAAPEGGPQVGPRPLSLLAKSLLSSRQGLDLQGPTAAQT